MKKIIVTTTILEPTNAIRKYDAMEDWNLIVTGDTKSPKEYPLERGRFMSWEQQQEAYPDMCDLIGPDSTARGRIIALLEAAKESPDVVATIDDDNYPMENWGLPVPLGAPCFVESYSDNRCFDPVSRWIRGYWHRGFPLEMRHSIGGLSGGIRSVTPLLCASLWNGDLDVDAVTRIEDFPVHAVFPQGIPLFTGGRFSPVNSQNTFISGKHLKDYFLFPFIGRVEDIWAGYVFQALHPNSTVYGPPTVIHQQYRSMASLVKDLEEEIYGYRWTGHFLRLLDKPGVEAALGILPPKAHLAWDIYRSYFK